MNTESPKAGTPDVSGHLAVGLILAVAGFILIGAGFMQPVGKLSLSGDATMNATRAWLLAGGGSLVVIGFVLALIASVAYGIRYSGLKPTLEK